MRSYDMDRGTPFLTSRIWPSTVAPTASNDVTQGVQQFDTWVNTTGAGNAWLCISNAAGAAVWTRFNTL